MSHEISSDVSPSAADGFTLLGADEQPVMQIDWVDEKPSGYQKAGDIDAGNLTQFSHWVSSIPSVGSAVTGNSKHLICCDIEFAKLMKAKDGTGSLGLIRKSGSTQIGAHVRLNEAKKLKTLVNTGLLLNLVSNLVAQQHLADINKKLEKIQSSLQEVIAFQKGERTSKLQAFYEKLQQVGQLISKGSEISEKTLQTISNNKQDVRGLVLHLKSDFEAKRNQIDKFDNSSLFGSNDLRQELQGIVSELGSLYKEYMLGMQCLVMANLILYFKEGCQEEFAEEGKKLAAELTSRDGIETNWKEMQRRIARHLNKMKPVFEFKSSTQANAQLVEKSVQRVNSMLQIESTMLLGLQQRMKAPQNQKMLLEVENGKIVRGSYLS